MTVTKEECLEALKWFRLKQCSGCLNKYPDCWSKCIDISYTTLKQLIHEHFKLEEKYLKLLKMWGMDSNPPLKFEELKDDMWVWDNLNKEFIQIEWLDGTAEYKYLMAHTVPSNEYQRLYSNNRFYRREVQDETN